MRVPGRSGSLPGGADGVLQAKVRVPGVPGWLVPRARLDRRLDEGAAGSLTVVTGPPGAGKTMAVASWAAARRGLVAWVTLDEFDSRPRVFWATVVEALRTAGVPLRRVAAAPARAAAADHVFLLRLASELAVQDPPVVLVLDDLHQLAGAGLMEGLAYLLRNARSGLRLVVCSRADPVLPLHRYRLAGELTEIRAGELAFSVAEAGQLMAQHRITLAPATLELLTRVDEGWAAGLRLAALSLGDHRDPGQFIKELAAENSAITGYLVEEALNNQPAEVRDLLLKTSIVDRVSAGIAAELTGRDQGAGTLAELARGNAFVQPPAAAGTVTIRCSPRCCGSSCGWSARPRCPACTGGRPAGTSATGCCRTRCGRPPRPGTGRWPPGWRWRNSRPRRWPTRTAAARWPAGSGRCRPSRPRPGRRPR